MTVACLIIFYSIDYPVVCPRKTFNVYFFKQVARRMCYCLHKRNGEKILFVDEKHCTEDDLSGEGVNTRNDKIRFKK